MKICPTCKGSGHIFGGVNPIRFATCITCRGIGTDMPPFNKHIRCHSLGTIVGKNEHIFKLSDFPENSLMAHVMAQSIGIIKKTS